MSVLDASALLCFLQDETGADAVEAALVDGGVVGSANWSEVAQKVFQRGGNWELARSLLLSYGLSIEPVSEADAELAARLWLELQSLSLGDRLCLALGERQGASVLTTDRQWPRSSTIIQVR